MDLQYPVHAGHASQELFVDASIYDDKLKPPEYRRKRIKDKIIENIVAQETSTVFFSDIFKEDNTVFQRFLEDDRSLLDSTSMSSVMSMRTQIPSQNPTYLNAPSSSPSFFPSAQPSLAPTNPFAPLNDDNIQLSVLLYLFSPDLIEPIHGKIEIWNVTQVTRMQFLFSFPPVGFDPDLSAWDVSNVVDMSFMFLNAFSFSSDLSSWNVTSVVNFNGMFHNCTSFNSDISGWNLSNAESISQMFDGASSFNGDLSTWQFPNVRSTSQMFKSASAFTGSSITQWNVSSIIDMESMFEGATSFNSSLRLWDIDSVLNFRSMFKNASSFDQILCWDINPLANVDDIFLGTVCAPDCIKVGDPVCITNIQ